MTRVGEHRYSYCSGTMSKNLYRREEPIVMSPFRVDRYLSCGHDLIKIKFDTSSCPKFRMSEWSGSNYKRGFHSDVSKFCRNRHSPLEWTPRYSNPSSRFLLEILLAFTPLQASLKTNYFTRSLEERYNEVILDHNLGLWGGAIQPKMARGDEALSSFFMGLAQYVWLTTSATAYWTFLLRQRQVRTTQW